jgi:hypothetical protein
LELDAATIDRARQLAGLKGYVTNLDPVERGHCHTQRPSRHAP